MHIQRPVLVVSQGGLAPVAVRLAARECDTWIGSRAVAGLVLSSPPEWDAIGEGYDRMEARARCSQRLFERAGRSDAAQGKSASPPSQVERNFRLLGDVLGAPTPLSRLGWRALCSRPFVR